MWVLVEHGVEPSRTHSVEDLYLNAAGMDPGFMDYVQLCATLTPYGVQARYPSLLQLDEDSAAGALDACDKIFTFVHTVQEFNMPE